jgi:hypothetical protein
MWMAWQMSPRKKLVIAIIDKSARTRNFEEHVSLNWVLNQERFTKTRTKLYKPDEDYFGFVPLNGQNFKIKGLEQFTDQQLEQLSGDADMVYFTDTYGVYSDDWFGDSHKEQANRILYGGMSQEDIQFLRNMKERHKLIISEFNSIGSPTPEHIRKQFQDMFGLVWTGWTGCYFSSLDTAVSKELPRWLVSNYKKGHDGKWPFRRPGIAFVNNTDQVVILEDSAHLIDAVPFVATNEFGQKSFGLPPRIRSPFWFDIIHPDPDMTLVVSQFVINTTGIGAKELIKNGIPQTFPALVMHKGNDYQFYYFSGDFCNNRIDLNSSRFKGIAIFSQLFYNNGRFNDRAAFFWNFYRPIMQHILLDYYRQRQPANVGNILDKGNQVSALNR